MSKLVLEPGAYSLVVDLGRPSHRSLGVPLGGAADRAAHMQGNALVGNEPSAACLEFALVGPTLKATCDIGCVVFGAPFHVTVDGEKIEPGHTFNLPSGATLRIGDTPRGARGYLCVAGGFMTKEILGSHSAFESIAKGQHLECAASVVKLRSLAEPLVHVHDRNAAVMLRAIDGPQAEWFDLSQFYGSTYTVAPACNRMGMRLQGSPLDRPKKELVSEAVCPGTVQVVNDGQCIILGVDGQTIGGYPKVATVIMSDLDVLGQLRPGQRVRFEQVTLELAETLWHVRQRRLNEILMRLQVAERFSLNL